MRIGKLAAKAGVSIQTIRFYERQQLLPNPERTEAGYRIFDDQDLHQLRFIRQAKEFGFSLDEIREILRMRERGKCPCADVIAIAETHLERTERQIRQLQIFARELNRAIKHWKASGERRLSADVICNLIERTIQSVPTERSERKQGVNNGKQAQRGSAGRRDVF